MSTVNWWFNPIIKQYEISYSQDYNKIPKENWIIFRTNSAELIAVWSQTAYTYIGLDLIKVEIEEEGDIPYSVLPYKKSQIIKMLNEHPEYKNLV